MKIFLKPLLIIIVIFFNIFILQSCDVPQKEQQNITKLTFWHGINPPPNREVFSKLLNKFNQSHPDIKVEDFYIGQPDQQLPKILTAIVGKQPPDMLWYTPQLTSQLVELDAIIPLEKWLNNSPRKTEIIPSLFETMELNRQIYSIPFATNNTAIFYRPSLFKEAGIQTIPQTWEELQKAAEKLTKDLDGDGKIDQHGMLLSLGKEEWVVFVWLPLMYSAGAEFGQNNQFNLVQDGTIKALEFGSNLVKNNLAILSPPERGYELDNFINGKVAMQITGPWTLGQLNQTKIDYDAFPIPKLEKSATVLGGENLFVFKTTPLREKACLEFLEYILSEEFQTPWAIKTGYLPINLKSEQSEEYQAFVKENPVLNIFLQQMKWVRSRPIMLGYNHLSENLGRAIESSLLGEKSPEEALDTAQKRLELILQDLP
ncbi:ABC transporter substrate-binding protein [Aphanothece hegewaldii CCALA 016]|uniref:ABC transporter substrate-binding protein n=1 Tax=Aphanothece hegewaldii CCALA 016 TaxID=2107694 RepID=A0A2T1LWP6_9CHRO|nr:ABC transporter substrate-binding protein [Aphanothece hegewaldii]PSF36577.1 ABC transporter substrate-binding protein [Aphanothece hegewaldii CCALA 016]